MAVQQQSQEQSVLDAKRVSSIPLFEEYEPHTQAWDELFHGGGDPHAHSRLLVQRLGGLQPSEFMAKRASADLVFINQGITFSVYSDRRGVEKIFPFDLIPRPVAAAEWEPIEAGLLQRIQALNLFLHDVYHDRRILREGVIPEELVLNSKCYRPEMIGFDPPGQAICPRRRHRPDPRSDRPIPRPGRQWPHAVGRQLRAGKPRGDEEGVSAAVPARAGCAASRIIRSGCAKRSCRSRRQRRRLADASCCSRRARTTPPISSTASWPATWASNWCWARTCSSHDDKVFLKTTRGPQRVDVIYRRLDDDFLDPERLPPRQPARRART